uniref:Midnolin-like n=1 Tax=Mastacembelus armatus TaxID=205130 RepID=A0A7N9APC1_9TELE
MEQQQRGLTGCTRALSAGCGAGVSTGQPVMRLSITSTTGCPVELSVPRGETVQELRARISQKLGLQTDRIVLLHNNRQLTAGRLLDLGVADGSKLTLLPVIEAGLCSTARAERTMMDVLESLTEVQVRISDFLSGRSPLTINLGLGTHVMYVQLQLSAQDVKKLQQDRNVTVQSSGEQHASTCSSSSTTGSTTSPASHTSTPVVLRYSTSKSAPINTNVHASSTAELRRQPGAVIESFVSHSPGIFSGTFSGTLAPCSQGVNSHPRRGIAIILQILNDLLRAACCHQGAPPTLPQRPCPALNLPVGPVLTAEDPSKARSKPLLTQRAGHFSKAQGPFVL